MNVTITNKLQFIKIIFKEEECNNIMKNSTKIILIIFITVSISLSIILGFYILGNCVKEGLLQLAININNGLRNFPVQ